MVDNYYINLSAISNYNDGNHVNGEPPEKTIEPEVEIIPCDDCGKEMEMQDHYTNGGLCLKCILKIGK